MLLSELGAVDSGRLVRDGQFRALGLIDHQADELLVALFQGRYLDRLLEAAHISCVITTEKLADRIPGHLGLLLAADPKRTLYDIHDFLFHHTDFYGVAQETRIAETAKVHPEAFVAPRDVCIDAGAIIEPHATILERSHIGEGAVIRAGSVIGAEGFGARRSRGKLVMVPHAGWVEIGPEAQILSNCTIMRGTFGGRTMIGEQTVLNAQSYVAHNASIGKRCLIAAGAVIAGSARVGDDVWIGPNAVISNSVSVGDRAWVSLGAMVIRDVAAGKRVSGYFAMPHRKVLRFLARWLRESEA